MSGLFDFNQTPPTSQGRWQQAASRKRQADEELRTRKRKAEEELRARQRQKIEDMKKLAR